MNYIQSITHLILLLPNVSASKYVGTGKLFNCSSTTYERELYEQDQMYEVLICTDYVLYCELSFTSLEACLMSDSRSMWQQHQCQSSGLL
jgi:hypothetical protein